MVPLVVLSLHLAVLPLAARPSAHVAGAAAVHRPFLRLPRSKRHAPVNALAFTNEDIHFAFSVATFAPQPFWSLMILAPRWSVTRAIMRPILPVLLFSLVHLFIVVVSAGQEGGTAPIAEFAGVFDPAPEADPQAAMVNMMRYENFVSEEWSHVLTWDLFVGRWIWADCLRRGIPVRASVLLTNLIGPPGFLLHLATCVVTGAGLPVGEALEVTPVPTDDAAPLPDRVSDVVRRCFDGQRFDAEGMSRLAACLDADVVWDDLSGAQGECRGREAVLRMLAAREACVPNGFRLEVDRIGDGELSTGFTWTRAVQVGEGHARGLRGTAYVELNPLNKRIAHVVEVAEPLVKPGMATAQLLRAVARPPDSPRKVEFDQRTPTEAADLVSYLWHEVQGTDIAEPLRLFADNVLYEDFNFPDAMEGKGEVKAFLEEFDIPGLRFVPDRISEGSTAACFTWRVAINGVDGRQIRGISYYELDPTTRLVRYVRDIPEPAIRPAPLLGLVSLLRPGLRKAGA